MIDIIKGSWVRCTQETKACSISTVKQVYSIDSLGNLYFHNEGIGYNRNNWRPCHRHHKALEWHKEGLATQYSYDLEAWFNTPSGLALELSALRTYRLKDLPVDLAINLRTQEGTLAAALALRSVLRGDMDNLRVREAINTNDINSLRKAIALIKLNLE